MSSLSEAWISAPVIAAIITGFVALLGLAVNQYRARQDQRRKDFAEALAAVERYAELPYRILRRQGSSPEVREKLAEKIHEIQQDLLFYKGWIRIQDQKVADAYDALLSATRREAGSAMSEAWKAAPRSSDAEMPLGKPFDFPEMRQKRNDYVFVVRQQLKPVLLRLFSNDNG